MEVQPNLEMTAPVVPLVIGEQLKKVEEDCEDAMDSLR